jgi:putative membrane protein
MSLFLHGDPLGNTPSREDPMSRNRFLWLGLAAIVIGGCSKTEGTKSEPVSVGTGGAGADVRSDADFVHDITLKNMAVLELSRVALAGAASTEVKTFARMMIRDHGVAVDQLRKIVAGPPFEWPAQLDDNQRERADELATKQGAEIDRDSPESRS